MGRILGSWWRGETQDLSVQNNYHHLHLGSIQVLATNRRERSRQGDQRPGPGTEWPSLQPTDKL